MDDILHKCDELQDNMGTLYDSMHNLGNNSGHVYIDGNTLLEIYVNCFLVVF